MVGERRKSYFRETRLYPDGHQDAGNGWLASCESASSHPETHDIPILATTALIRPHDLKACLEAGCNGYIVKPFGRLELHTKIIELLPRE